MLGKGYKALVSIFHSTHPNYVRNDLRILLEFPKQGKLDLYKYCQYFEINMQLLNMKIDLKVKLNNDEIIDMFLQNANRSDTLFYLSETDRRSTDPSDKENFSS